MTKLCVTLSEETTSGLVERMAALAGIADLFEIRADRVLDLDLLALLRARTRPLVLTCRSASQGGDWADDDPRRRLTLLEGVKRGFDYVDVEDDSGFFEVMSEKAGRGLIVSHHDLEGTPSDLDGLYERMAGLGADIVKIVVTPRSVADVGRLMGFAARCATVSASAVNGKTWPSIFASGPDLATRAVSTFERVCSGLAGAALAGAVSGLGLFGTALTCRAIGSDSTFRKNCGGSSSGRAV